MGLIPLTYLAHELWDDSVKSGALESETFFAGAERAKIFRSFRDDVFPELENDPAEFLAVGGHVEVNLGREIQVIIQTDRTTKCRVILY